MTWLAALATLCIIAPPALAASGRSRELIPLSAVASDDRTSGRAEFRSTGGRSRFRVRVSGAEPGETLDLRVGGVGHGTLVSDDDGNASVEFRMPASGGRHPLDFDPRGQEIEVEDAHEHVLTSATPDGSTPPGTFIDERMNLLPTGAEPGASGQARLRTRDGRSEFEVEIQQVPDGAYDVLIDGSAKGTIAVTGGVGEIEFEGGSDDVGEHALDFDPLGALVQVGRGGTIILSGTGLASAPGVNACTPSEGETPLANVGPDPDASGSARVRVDTDCRHDFRVEIQDLPVGSYDLVVGGILRGTIVVATRPDGRVEGELEFASRHDDDDELPLDFDPTGQTIDVRQGDTTFLSTTVSAPPPAGSCEAVATAVALSSSGADPRAHGTAQFEQGVDCRTHFDVEVEDAPLGDYQLLVGGVLRGTITVAIASNRKAKGEIEFASDPDEENELRLDFDPRGQGIEIRHDGTLLLSVTFPG
jgi:hypothetical protein